LQTNFLKLEFESGIYCLLTAPVRGNFFPFSIFDVPEKADHSNQADNYDALISSYCTTCGVEDSLSRNDSA
jgi:hypothetical protein